MRASMGAGAEMRLRSAPFPVEWAGFTSDTYRMQQCGWKIAVEYDMMRMGYRLMFTHETLRLYALTAETVIDFQVQDYRGAQHLPPFRVNACAARFEVLKIHDNIMNFQEIDATPVYEEMTIQRPEDLNVFKTVSRNSGGEEIIVDKADMTVIEHLEAIKELQSEEQKRIRERMLQGPQMGEQFVGPEVETEVVANVIALHG